jgi:tetratricopeptide (TPR) repeat protein
MIKTLLTILGIILLSLNISAQKIISLEQNNLASSLTNAGIQNIKDKNSVDAINNLLAAISVDPKYRDAYIQLYQAWLIRKERSQEVFLALEKGSSVFFEDDEFYFYCGEIQRSFKDYLKAINQYSKAIELGKKNGEDFFLVPYYYLNRGNSYLKTEKYDLALADYNYLLSINQESLGGLTNRGITYYKLKNKEKACADCQHAIRSDY